MASTLRGLKSFRREITDATQWPNKSNQDETEPDSEIDKFVPAPDIEALTTQSRIKEVLEILRRGNLLARIHDADPPVKKIFLILARAEMLSLTEKFISENFNPGDFSDQHLPITFSELDDRCVVKSAQHPSSSDCLLQDSNLGHGELGWFKVLQWRFLSPIFKDGFEFHLQADIPLPLIEKDGGQRSGFSVVYKVKLHPAHIPQWPTGYLAMKEINLPMKEINSAINEEAKYVIREMENLESLKQLNHRHLIRPVAICTRGKQAFFFFPWAEDGDLYSFWKRTDPTGDENMVQWMLEQMVGLGKALKKLAEKNCRHSDLKPQNILLFPGDGSKGTLKITDVGLSKFQIMATSRRMKGTTAKYTTERYSPPEFHRMSEERLREHVEGSGDLKLSRKFDIWSLGCVFVEFLIWTRLGQKKYKRFDKSMNTSVRFWESKYTSPESSDSESPLAILDSSDYQLHEKVKERLEELKRSLQQTTDDTVILRVLRLVEEKMLVIDCSKRFNASEVCNRLKAIQDRTAFAREQ